MKIMDLAYAIRAYKKMYLPGALAELDYFRNLPSLELCINNAALAINKNGKRYRHQYRISNNTLFIVRDILLDHVEFINEIEDFDELFILIDGLLKSVKGIGELYIYDTALRIGENLGHSPKKVYLHSGTRIGARRLGFKNKYVIEMNELPDELQHLEPFEVEDILCIFEDKLGTIKG
jgi:hypothetical protein